MYKGDFYKVGLEGLGEIQVDSLGVPLVSTREKESEEEFKKMSLFFFHSECKGRSEDALVTVYEILCHQKVQGLYLWCRLG